MLSQSQANFFINKPISSNHPLLKDVFKESSYEIFQFLDTEDITNLKYVNHFFLDLCDCHELLTGSMDSLSQLFSMSVEVTKPKVSKVREKYNFNKPIDVYYKNTKEYDKRQRIQSAKRKKK